MPMQQAGDLAAPEILEELRRHRPARARLEEFADTRMGEVFIWRFFNEIVGKRSVWGEKADESIVRNTLEIEIPQVLDSLENELPAAGCYFFGEIGISDIAVAAFLRNAEFAGFSVDAERWPLAAGFARGTLSHPSFFKLRSFEDLLLKTRIEDHRDALAAAGAPISPTTLATDLPQREVLST